jgi:hypothetical protein
MSMVPSEYSGFPKTDRHDITEILLKVALKNTITPNQLVRTTLLPKKNFRYDIVYYFLPDKCDSDNIRIKLDIFWFSRTIYIS